MYQPRSTNSFPGLFPSERAATLTPNRLSSNQTGDSSSAQYVYDAARIVTSHSMRSSGSIASGVVEETVARWTPPLHRWHSAYEHPGLGCSAFFFNTQTWVPRSFTRLFHAPYRFTGAGVGVSTTPQVQFQALQWTSPQSRGVIHFRSAS